MVFLFFGHNSDNIVDRVTGILEDVGYITYPTEQYYFCPDKFCFW